MSTAATDTVKVTLYDQQAGTDADAPDELRPAWLPQQFGNPEDLAKSWEHATRKLTEMGQQNGDLRRELAGASEARQILESRLEVLERAFIARAAGVPR